MVSLKEFVKDVLYDIHLAVQELNDVKITTAASKDIAHFKFEEQQGMAQNAPIEFDVAVIATTEKRKDNTVGASVKVIEGKLNEKILESKEHVSRIKFGIVPCWIPKKDLKE